MSNAPIFTLKALSDELGCQIQGVESINPNPVIAQYQLACIRDLASEMYMLSARLTKQLQHDAQKLTKKEDTNG